MNKLLELLFNEGPAFVAGAALIIGFMFVCLIWLLIQIFIYAFTKTKGK